MGVCIVNRCTVDCSLAKLYSFSQMTHVIETAFNGALCGRTIPNVCVFASPLLTDRPPSKHQR